MQQSAHAVLAGGESVIVDATFLEAPQRDAFIGMARCSAAPALILYCVAPLEVLEARISIRSRQGGDPSEADETVLARQRERFIPPEGDAVITVETHAQVDVAALAKQIRRSAHSERTA